METADLKQQFRELLKASGWTQAEAARQLCITPGALSQIVRSNSPVKPSPVTLRLFKLLLVRQNPEAQVTLQDAPHKPDFHLEEEERNLIEALRQMPHNARRHVVKAFNLIIISHRPIGGSNPERSKSGGWCYQ
jgi:transcriptional regulator with XRE-family HTH domain